MRGHYREANKNPRIKWDRYEPYESEPRARKSYELSPEVEEELMDNGYFLKARVRRNMRRIRKEYVVAAHRNNDHRGNHSPSHRFKWA